MSQYLLLRNNKESGPFTTDQLISMGLRVYDLVWENGKSAAWRYPSEVPALKQFVPDAEKTNEMFLNLKQEKKIPSIADNTFVKKEKPRIKIKADWKKVEGVETVPIVSNGNIFISKASSSVKTNTTEKQNEFSNNHQYVSINNKSSNAEKAVVPVTQPHIADKEQPTWKDAWLNWEEEKKSVSGLKNEPQKKKPVEKKYDFISAKKEIKTPVLETKFSQSLDDIKEKYVENILNSKLKKSINLSGFFNKQILVLALLVGLVSWGMYVAFFMKDDSANNNLTAVKTAPVVIPQKIVVPKDISSGDVPSKSTVDNTTDNDDNISSDNFQDDNSLSTNKNNLPEPQQQKNASINSVKLKKSLRKNSPLISNENLSAKQNIKPLIKQNLISDSGIPIKNNFTTQANISTSQTAAHSQVVQQNDGQYTRSVARRNDNNSFNNNSYNNNYQPSENVAPTAFQRNAPRKRIEDYVTVNSYGNTFNGVQNVHLNVQNVADVPIDLAVVDIQYFDANNRFQKGETVYVNNIPANDNVDVKVPDSRNSSHIDYKVSLVSASQKTLYMVQ